VRVTDAALVLRARGGDQSAFERLAERHAHLLSGISHDYFPPPGMDRSDLDQEALFGLHKAVRDYQPQPGSVFRSFAALVVRRQLITALKAATRKKHRHLNDSFSFDHPLIGASDDGDLTLEDVLPGGEDAPAVLERREELGVVVGTVRRMSPLERRVMGSLASGDSYEAVTAATGRGYKTVDNAAQRGKRKIRNALEAAA
jgi:RNA polymerase sporulation-specific sigma factor